MSSFLTTVLGAVLIIGLIVVLIYVARPVPQSDYATSTYAVWNTHTPPPPQSIPAAGITPIKILASSETFSSGFDSLPRIMYHNVADPTYGQSISFVAEKEAMLTGTVSFTLTFTVTSGQTNAPVRLGVARVDPNFPTVFYPLATQVDVFPNTAGSATVYGLSFSIKVRAGSGTHIFVPIIDTAVETTGIVEGDLNTYVSGMTLAVVN